jgi:hypothetical protein
MKLVFLLVFSTFAHAISSQVPLSIDRAMSTPATEFKLEEGSDVFAPRDLIQLARPGAGVANAEGDLVLVSVSKYSFEDKKYVGRLAFPRSFHQLNCPGITNHFTLHL